MEETPPEQGVSIQGVLQFRTPEAGLSIQKINPCDMCGPVLKDILHMAEHQGTHPRYKPYKCEVCGKGFLLSANSRQYQGYCREKPITCRDVVDNHGLLQYQASQVRASHAGARAIGNNPHQAPSPAAGGPCCIEAPQVWWL